MDTIYNSNRILSNNNWVAFRIYRNPIAQNNWKSRLDWYHQVLINVLRPVVAVEPNLVLFFGTYGPEPYRVENEKYEVKLLPKRTTTDFQIISLTLKRLSQYTYKCVSIY